MNGKLTIWKVRSSYLSYRFKICFCFRSMLTFTLCIHTDFRNSAVWYFILFWRKGKLFISRLWRPWRECNSQWSGSFVGWLVMVFNATFINISVRSWRSVALLEETGGTRENHQPTASHGQILSHNVASSTSRLSGIRAHNCRHWLHW